MQYDHEIGRLVNKLNGFSNAQRLADFLETEGIKGVKMNACMCPIARWVSKSINYQQCVTMNYNLRVGSANHTPYMLSPVVHLFIQLFDAGKFPQLEDRAHYDAFQAPYV